MKYVQMDINLQMSFIETFNISVLEMWACGKPVLVGPGNRVLVEGNATLLSHAYAKDHTNPAAVKSDIMNCLDMKQIIINAQYDHLEELNKNVKLRWQEFFE